jgi:hypothetical protein
VNDAKVIHAHAHVPILRLQAFPTQVHVVLSAIVIPAVALKRHHLQGNRVAAE